jgi:hypothetical protein
VNGFRCSPNDPDDYLHHLRRLLDDAALWRTFSEKGRTDSLASDWAELTARYCADLTRLVGISIHNPAPLP